MHSVICPQCGDDRPSDKGLCVRCGTPLPESDPDSSREGGSPTGTDGDEDRTLLGDSEGSPPRSSVPVADEDATLLADPEEEPTRLAPDTGVPSGSRPRLQDARREPGAGSEGDSPDTGPLRIGQDFGDRYHIIELLGL